METKYLTVEADGWLTDEGVEITPYLKKNYKKGNEFLENNQYTEAINSGVTDPEILAEFQVPVETTSADVLEYRIKGTWYFDKRQGQLRYRLVALSPIIPDVFLLDSDEPDLIEPFWVFFPDTREVLNEAMSFNNKNTSMPISFDHMLNSRRFSSTMYKEENVYQDRKIEETQEELSYRISKFKQHNQ